MSETPAATSDRHEPGGYERRLQGRLDPRRAAWFGGRRLTHERGAATVLARPVVDQPALHGLLRKARDLRRPLVSVTPAGAGGPDALSPESR